MHQAMSRLSGLAGAALGDHSRAYVDTLITDHQASTVGSRSAPSD
jgi:hypothetical protein